MMTVKYYQKVSSLTNEALQVTFPSATHVIADCGQQLRMREISPPAENKKIQDSGGTWPPVGGHAAFGRQRAGFRDERQVHLRPGRRSLRLSEPNHETENAAD
jgi:hypothetical protein